MGERYARRIVLFIATVPLLIGTVLQVATYSTGQLAAGRVVAGLGFGAITSTLPIWQNETSPAAMRGMLICASLSMLIVSMNPRMTEKAIDHLVGRSVDRLLGCLWSFASL